MKNAVFTAVLVMSRFWLGVLGARLVVARMG